MEIIIVCGLYLTIYIALQEQKWLFYTILFCVDQVWYVMKVYVRPEDPKLSTKQLNILMIYSDFIGVYTCLILIFLNSILNAPEYDDNISLI